MAERTMEKTAATATPRAPQRDGSASRGSSRSQVESKTPDPAASLSARLGSMVLLEKEAEGIVFEDPEETTIRPPRWAAIGKACTARPLNKMVLERSMQRAWGLHKEARFRDLGGNIFEVQFGSEGDWKHAMSNGPWQYDFNVLMLKEMVDDDGPWYDELIEEFDKERRARAIENRKLDQASTRTKDTSSLCGFVWSLSVWMWEWLPVRRPMIKNPDNPNPNQHEGIHDQDPYRRPTVAYCLDQVSLYTGSSHVRYKCYVNELDTLNVEKVFWWPYENDRDSNLNEMCTRDNLLWRARCPMIFFYTLEWHFVDHVARKFGKLQGGQKPKTLAFGLASGGQTPQPLVIGLASGGQTAHLLAFGLASEIQDKY
ncbi:Alpha-L-arabinofuranosidase 1 [Hordeum vulgare]|nr:Alpha-L-arabinofuranosidase 1 [Hordeum vulgare]